MKTNRTDRTGMSIVELMIVLSVIAVLGAIAAYAVSSIREKVRIQQAEQDLARLAAAINQLEFDTGDWPSLAPNLPPFYGHTRRNNKQSGTLPEIWDLSSSNAGLVATDGKFAGWKGPYLESIPTDPWGRSYFFDPDYWPDQTGLVCAVVGSFGPSRSTTHDFDSDNIYVKIKQDLMGSR